MHKNNLWANNRVLAMLKQMVNKVTIVPLKVNIHSTPYSAFLRDNSTRRPLDDNVRVPETVFGLTWNVFAKQRLSLALTL